MFSMIKCSYKSSNMSKFNVFLNTLDTECIKTNGMLLNQIIKEN